MTTKLCLFYPEFGSFPYVFSILVSFSYPFMCCLSIPFRFSQFSLALSSAALMCRNRSGNASTLRIQPCSDPFKISVSSSRYIEPTALI